MDRGLELVINRFLVQRLRLDSVSSGTKNCSEHFLDREIYFLAGPAVAAPARFPNSRNDFSGELQDSLASATLRKGPVCASVVGL